MFPSTSLAALGFACGVNSGTATPAALCKQFANQCDALQATNSEPYTGRITYTKMSTNGQILLALVPAPLATLEKPTTLVRFRRPITRCGVQMINASTPTTA